MVGCESVCVLKYVCVRSLSQVNSHMSLGAINISNITLSLSVCLILFCLSLFLSLLLYFCLSMSAEVWIECVWLISLNSLTRRHPISSMAIEEDIYCAGIHMHTRMATTKDFFHYQFICSCALKCLKIVTNASHNLPEPSIC